MARNAEKFEAKCTCGAVKIGKEWRNSFLINGISETEGLKMEKCPECQKVKMPHGNRMSFALD
jgi:hypothetical protein